MNLNPHNINMPQALKTVSGIPDPLKCPTEILQEIKLYKDNGIILSPLLRAVLTNNLLHTVANSSQAQWADVPHIVAACYTHLHCEMWGSESMVRYYKDIVLPNRDQPKIKEKYDH